MKQAAELKEQLKSIDRRGYPAYKSLQGIYRFPDHVLSVDHVQGDPFAAPSKLSITVDRGTAAIPPELLDADHKRIRVQDHLTRLFHSEAERYNFKAKGSGKSGLLSVSRPGQEILERTACVIHDGNVMIRFEVGFPANGRSVNAGELDKILFDFLPKCVHAALFYANIDSRRLIQAVRLSEDQHYIRGRLRELGLAAFVADGAVLPRESGVSNRPMKKSVAFISPASLSTTLDLPNHGPLTGMGIRKGITLIVGGGYHGKSTLLRALESGVYDHTAGDGREYVITDDSAVKLRAEDGRSVRHVDISLFINHLPDGRDTRVFSTEDASGSTSQAAGTIEAVESGTKLFLIDEDTSATNFMLRDQLMQEVIHRDKEPITPFLERAAAIYKAYDISTVLVAGSSGSFFHIADTILQMDAYLPYDITEEAKEISKAFAPPEIPAVSRDSFPVFARAAKPSPSKEDRVKVKLLGRDSIQLNKEIIDMRFVEQLADPEQLMALGYIVQYAMEKIFDGKKTVQEAVNTIENILAAKGLAGLTVSAYLPSGLAMPRRQEIFACLNRCRSLQF